MAQKTIYDCAFALLSDMIQSNGWTEAYAVITSPLAAEITEALELMGVQPLAFDFQTGKGLLGPVPGHLVDTLMALANDGAPIEVVRVGVELEGEECPGCEACNPQPEACVDAALGSPFSPREDVLYDAAQTITQDRNDQYGEPEDAFTTVAHLWNAYLFDGEPELDGVDVGMLMALLKVGRIKHNPGKRDSYVDLAGYAACAAEIAGVAA